MAIEPLVVSRTSLSASGSKESVMFARKVYMHLRSNGVAEFT
jgi:hypothetical protein